jgi:hypothetical protein
MALKLDGIELKAAQPYIAQHTSMTLLDGRVSADAKIALRSGETRVQFTGNVSVAALHTVDNRAARGFHQLGAPGCDGSEFPARPGSAGIDQVTARKLYARVIIEPDRTLNVKRVMAGPGASDRRAATVPGGEPVAQTAPPAPAAPAGKSAASKSRAAKVAPRAPAPAAAPMMPMSIKKILLHAGAANFSDLSLQPNFATGIQSIEGTVTGLSSKPNSRAKWTSTVRSINSRRSRSPVKSTC